MLAEPTHCLSCSMKGIPMFLAAIAAFFLQAAQATSTPPASPVVVELFTSQSCSSCPPAEAFLRELAKRDDVIALEWHVDYWDKLHHGSAGKWKDPYSSPTHTARQRAYNTVLRGTTGVYTPQAIINGATETVGSRRKQVDTMIADAAGLKAKVEAKKVNDKIVFSFASTNAEALLVTFDRSAQTRVAGGENKGLDLAESHVVTAHQKLGAAKNGGTEFQVNAPEEGFGCALLLQDQESKRILGAAYCPA